MSREQNIQAQVRFGEAINSGHLEAMRDLVAPDVVEHDPAPNQGAGAEGYMDMFRELRTAFPDLKVTPEHLTADEDTVALAYTMTGTHEGPFQGIEATHTKVKARGVQIARFADGKMVERWGSSDELGLLKQIGVEPKQSLAQKLGIG